MKLNYTYEDTKASLTYEVNVLNNYVYRTTFTEGYRDLEKAKECFHRMLSILEKDLEKGV